MSIKETVFCPKNYLVLRKSISTSHIADKEMYEEAGKKLGAYLKQNNLSPAGPWSVLYFSWDEENKKADIGISFPVVELGEVKDLELISVDIPQIKASMDTLIGPYEKLGQVHQSLMKYVSEKGYDVEGFPAIAIEEYEIDPMSDPNPENWKTNVYYLHG